ncbi:mitochondrial mRNA pseudouridine synthase RPUSD3 isoform X1 [Xenopus tropicalis]|uniref:Mitochondrial mRNA pseudouridine synthase RPUSD3 isoform X1 n=1 Tax=Xenopus tropicalis TaxID=8364 RepID=A0A8J0QJP9_XENTR|nr:mitochondrial mRNA pseudouridine synthase RPUSD3 isoform X1 [Xenopus tropicalis]
MALLCRQLGGNRSGLALIDRFYFRASCHFSNVSRVPWYKTHLDVRDKGRKPRSEPQSSRVSILRDPGVFVVDKMSRERICQLLVENVVYLKGPLVAINKPQGLSITGKEQEVSVSSLLADLQQHLGLGSDLHIVKAAPKESSGLVLLSTCHMTTKRLEDYYALCRKAQKPTASYCAVMAGVPHPAEGEIKAALKLERIEDWQLVVPVTDPSKGRLERREIKRTLTRYKVLDSADGCALVQLQPMSVFQAQLLVHSTLMFCRILGDHTYSARVGKVLGENIFVPMDIALPRTQVLEENVLRRMHFTQQQMHRMPLHLHFQQLMIPGESPAEGDTFLDAPPPPFFQRTLQLLGLYANKQLCSDRDTYTAK